MGQNLMRRAPKYVQGFIDRHGKPRWYFRRPGVKRTPLPGLPWAPEFMAAYEMALAGQPVQIGSARVKPGTIRSLAVSYFSSIEFRSLRSSSKVVYRNIIERFCREHGDKRVALLQREHISKLLASRAEKPWAANALRNILRALMRHAIEIGLRTDDPTRDVRAIRLKSDGYHSWLDDEIAQFENRHPIGFAGAACTCTASLNRPATLGCYQDGAPKHSQRLLAYPSAKDRDCIVDPGSYGTRRDHRANASRSSDILNNPIWQPIFGNWL
jgi:hypothetical protein